MDQRTGEQQERKPPAHERGRPRSSTPVAIRIHALVSLYGGTGTVAWTIAATVTDERDRPVQSATTACA